LIVVDANVLARLLISSENPPFEAKVFALDPCWLAPPILRSEFRNVLTTSVRNGKFDIEEAIVFMEQADRILNKNEFRVSSIDVLSLAAQSGCTAYDCEYVALAMALQIPLVTRDREILAAFPKVAVSPEEFIRD
jgi:predicted nucleic acid-binding protein